MGHKITKRDAVYLLPLKETFNGKGWHGLGIPTEEFTAANVKKALFRHDMAPAGINVVETVKQGAVARKVARFVPTGQRYAVNADDGLPVGPAVGALYWTPQNEELFELFAEALAGSSYKLCSVLTIDDCREFAIDAVGSHIKAGKRDFAPFVGCYRAFGGTSSLVFSGHGMVMQCHNTTSLFLREARKRDDAQKFKNTSGLEGRMDEVKKAIADAHGVNAEFASALADADSVPMTVDDARKAYVGMLCDKTPLLGASGNLRTVNRVKTLVGLFQSGKGNSGETVGDWFNGATEFYTFKSAGGDRELDDVKPNDDGAKVDPKDKQFYASEFGPARTFKARLANRLFEGGAVAHATLAELLEIGAKRIADADKEALVKAEFFA